MPGEGTYQTSICIMAGICTRKRIAFQACQPELMGPVLGCGTSCGLPLIMASEWRIISADCVIGRDTDSGSLASPNRETEAH